MNNKCLCGCGQSVKNPANKYIRFHDRVGKYRDEENKIHYCQCGCNGIIEWRKEYSYRGIPKFIYQHQMRLPRKVLYGSEEKANKILEKICKKTRGKNKPEGFGKKVTERQLGVSFEERFGIEKSKKIKSKMSLNARDRILHKIHSYDNVELCEYDKSNMKVFRHFFCGQLGINEKQILDYIQSKIHYNIERFFYVDCSSDKKACLIFPDGYCREKNIIFEVDEIDHYRPSRVKKDIIREYYIKKKIDCTIIRLDEQEMLIHIKNNTIPEELKKWFEKDI